MSQSGQLYIQTESLKQQHPSTNSRSREGMPRPRRKSSGLGADITGDTGAPALSTLNPMPTIPSPQLTPRNSDAKVPRVHSKRRKAKNLFRRWKNMSFKHTWVNPLILVTVLLSAYAVNPSVNNPLHSAIFLSYPLEPTHPHIPAHTREMPDMPQYYGKGWRDVAFVSFYIIVLSFTREFLMQRVIRPAAIYCGIRSRAKQSRFMEQVYTAIYFSIFGPYGLYVMSRTPIWYFNTSAMFEGFPHRAHDGWFKAYYLLQASYWAQQAIVLMLQLEKPRKDFKELVGHHIVTLALIALSYRFHFTYMGIAVYITHDISDFFLATSKTLNYLNHPLTVPYFTLFMGVWIYLRHYINLTIIYAVLTTFRTIGPYELNWETQQYKCLLSQVITFSLLASLQSINLFWLYLIVKIALNVVFKSTVEDVRSDADDDDEEAEQVHKGKAEARKALGVDTPAQLKENSGVQLNGKAHGGRDGLAANGSANKPKVEQYPSATEGRKAR